MRNQPGWCAKDAVSAAHRLGLIHGQQGVAIGKRRVESLKIDTQTDRVQINYSLVSKILTENKMCRKEILLELRKLVRLIPPDPLGRRNGTLTEPESTYWRRSSVTCMECRRAWSRERPGSAWTPPESRRSRVLLAL
jgi:hypothetical protein